MCLLAKFGGHRSYRNGYLSSYIDTLEKLKLIASICYIARFLKSGIPIYNSEVADTAGRKQEKGDERHRKLQRVTSFTQTQKSDLPCGVRIISFEMFLDKSLVLASRYTWILAAANVSGSERFLENFVIK